MRAGTLALPMFLAACLPPGPLPDTPRGDAPVEIVLDTASQRVTVRDPSPTISAIWDRALQAAILEAGPGPTVTSRAAAILHTALYDVWAAYDPAARPTEPNRALRRPPERNTEARKREAMSHAAYVLLSGMFPDQQARFDAVMDALGYETHPTYLSDTPAGYARVIASRVMAARRLDGSNWDDGFEDDTGYVPANPGPLSVTAPDRWTPENTPVDPETGDPDQEFMTPQWAGLTPFALPRPDAFRPVPPEPFLVTGRGGEVDAASRQLTLSDGRVLRVTPDLVGPVINPGFVAQAEEVLAVSAGLGDREKLIAEFWEDNKDTTFPPGTWLVFGQYVSARDDHTMAEDAVMFFALANALLDASIATWDAKVVYDYARPVRAIRTLGRLGLIGAPGSDELTGETGNVVRAWGGPGQGTRTILAANWLSYQNPDEDPSPPFAEYPSGHSAFSAAAAEVLAAFSGGDRFGASVTFPAGSSRFEPGVTPAAPVTLRWDTFSDAADEAGVSRVHGGIHFRDGDIRGRALGRAVGRAVVEKVRALATAEAAGG